MAKTIVQIQAMITSQADLREIINELADYLQANPPGGSIEGQTGSYDMSEVAFMEFTNGILTGI